MQGIEFLIGTEVGRKIIQEHKRHQLEQQAKSLTDEEFDREWEKHCDNHPIVEGEEIDVSRLDLPRSFKD